MIHGHGQPCGDWLGAGAGAGGGGEGGMGGGRQRGKIGTNVELQSNFKKEWNEEGHKCCDIYYNNIYIYIFVFVHCSSHIVPNILYISYIRAMGTFFGYNFGLLYSVPETPSEHKGKMGIIYYSQQTLFNHTWDYVNEVTFGKPLGIVAGCQGNLPWLGGWNFQSQTLTSREAREAGD